MQDIDDISSITLQGTICGIYTFVIITQDMLAGIGSVAKHRRSPTISVQGVILSCSIFCHRKEK